MTKSQSVSHSLSPANTLILTTSLGAVAGDNSRSSEFQAAKNWLTRYFAYDRDNDHHQRRLQVRKAAWDRCHRFDGFDKDRPLLQGNSLPPGRNHNNSATTHSDSNQPLEKSYNRDTEDHIKAKVASSSNTLYCSTRPRRRAGSSTSIPFLTHNWQISPETDALVLVQASTRNEKNVYTTNSDVAMHITSSLRRWWFTI